uniref:Trichohyalin-plectin-homology domain-containing protein n=1 Tax=Seriola lalandi dorsalis TaxID=1841481 RepID=A0A3B4XFJ0_SERLL
MWSLISPTIFQHVSLWHVCVGKSLRSAQSTLCEMAPPEQVVLSRAGWDRVQSSSNRPKDKMQTRTEMVEKEKVLKAQLRNMHEDRKFQKQASEEYLQTVAAEEVELKMQDRQKALDKANMKRFLQNGCVRKFNREVQTTRVQKENESLLTLRKEKQRTENERIFQSEEQMKSRQEEALIQDQQKANHRRLQNQSVAAYLAEQIKEKKLLKDREKRQEKVERDRLRRLDEEHAQKLRIEAIKKSESKKNYLNDRLEDISRGNLLREREAQKVKIEEKDIIIAQSNQERNLQLRKNDQAEKLRTHQIPIKIVTDKLAVTEKEQAASAALREQARLSKEVSELKAKASKQQKQELEKRASVLKSIAAHREAQIREKKQKVEADRKSNQDWFQTQKKSDTLFLEEQKRKAQKIREDKIKCCDYNFTMMAEKRARAEQLKREEHDFIAKDAEQAAERERKFQQYVQCEIQKAAEEKRNVSQLLAARSGGQGVLLDGENSLYCCQTVQRTYYNLLPCKWTNGLKFWARLVNKHLLMLTLAV